MGKYQLIAAFIAAGMVTAAAGSAGGPVIRGEEYISAYLAIYNDYMLGGGKFTKNELLDVIDCYFSEPDLDVCANLVGERSGFPVGFILAKAGTVYCRSGWSCANVGDTCCAYNPETGKNELYRCE